MGFGSVGDIQFISAMDERCGQSVQLHDFGVPCAGAEILLGDAPERIALGHGMHTVGFGLCLCADYGDIVNSDPGVDARFLGGAVFLDLFAEQNAGLTALHDRLALVSDLGNDVIIIALDPGGDCLGGRVIGRSGCFELDLCALADFRCSRSGRLGGLDGFGRLIIGREEFLHFRTESIHALAMLGEPVHDIAVVGSDALLMTFAMADDALLGKTILLAEIHAEFDCLLVYLVEVDGIGQIIFADFKADIAEEVSVALGTAAGMPSADIPGERLVGGNCTVLQFADKAVDANLAAAGMIGVPVVVVLVHAEQSVIGSDIALQPRIISASRVNHDAFDSMFLTVLVAFIFSQNKLTQIHCHPVLSPVV